MSLIHTLTILICLAALFSYVNHRLLKLPITIGLMAVQPMGDGVQLVLGVARQVYALGQVLAQQAIGVLVGTVLPGAVRIGKEDLDREPLGQLFVVGRSPMSSGYARLRRRAICSVEQPSAKCVFTCCPQPRIQECARPPRLTCVGCGPHLCRVGAKGVASRGVWLNSRFTVLGARPHPFAIVRNDWPWVRTRLTVSRSMSLKCV